MANELNIVILGLSITSSWENDHATTYRGLVRELTARGHKVLFLERDVPWYAAHRDMPDPPYGCTGRYADVPDLRARFTHEVQRADMVIVGSYLPDGIEVGQWVLDTARSAAGFYDIDTPTTLRALRRGRCDYLLPDQISQYRMYLSFSNGRSLDILKHKYGSPMARPLLCSVDAQQYKPMAETTRWDLGYLGTFRDDCQPPLEALMLEPARRLKVGRFVVAGPKYPQSVSWPTNVERIDHLPPAERCRFYNAQRATLNITRCDMARLGHTPSKRLFEAAACGVPIISDYWEGLESFLEPDREIMVSYCAEQTISHLRSLNDTQRQRLGDAARRKVLARHTAAHRAAELEQHIMQVLDRPKPYDNYGAFV